LVKFIAEVRSSGADAISGGATSKAESTLSLLSACKAAQWITVQHPM